MPEIFDQNHDWIGVLVKALRISFVYLLWSAIYRITFALIKRRVHCAFQEAAHRQFTLK